MTMVVQHWNNRLSLSCVDPSEELHEFQIVHAWITCRKQAFAEENVRNTSNSHENESQPPDSKSVRRRKGNKEASFVTTIRQTFNAFAQATNSSLCAKQNGSAHPASIASTVKNIISQFSRQTCHGAISCASPSRSATPKLNTSPTRRNKTIRKKAPSEKEPSLNNGISHPSLLQPQSSNGLTLECAPIKTAVIRQSNPIATKPKTRSVRARNAHRLIRHESAPIPPPGDAQGAIKKPAASVRRSKSDAVCYTSVIRQTTRKTESNVQTKVLHFENCCKGKGPASMCLECRKHSLKEGLPFPSARSSSTLPKTEPNQPIKPKQENYVGALSYHKPSIITQSLNASAMPSSVGASSVKSRFEISQKKNSPTARSKAVVCPGGTFFVSATVPKPIPNGSRDGPANPDIKIPAQSKKNENLALTCEDCSSDVTQCSQMKRKHSDSEDEPMQNKRGNKETDAGNTAANEQERFIGRLRAPSQAEYFESSMPILPSNVEIEHSNKDTCGASGLTDSAVACENQNLYSKLSNFDKSTEKMPESSQYSKITKGEDLQLPLDYDSSDTSSLSSMETTLSTQDYLARSSRRSMSLRRIPCTKYLESLRIPTPVFLLSKDSFFARRQQLAMHFVTQQKDCMSRLPDDVVVQIFSYLDTRSLAKLKCVCQDFCFLINSYDIRGTDSMWVKDKRYIDDPCKSCRKLFTPGDVSMCRYHAKSYHCDLPYGRSNWMCCFKIERSAPGCQTGIHDNCWRPLLKPATQE